MSQVTTQSQLAKPTVPQKSNLAEELKFLDEKVSAELQVLVKSGMFGADKDIYKAVAKVRIGQTMGLSLVQSLQGIFLQSNGTPTFTANLMTYLIKASGKYRYKVKMTQNEVDITYFEKIGNTWEEIGNSIFSEADAKLAGLSGKDTYKKFPRNLYFARAMSNGAKWYCSDVFGSSTPYTPDEIPNSPYQIDAETLEVVETKEVTAKPLPKPKVVVKDEEEIEKEDKVIELLQKEIQTLMKATNSNFITYEKHFGVNNIGQLTESDCNELIDLLNVKLRGMNLSK
jgi:hypothetical protein